MSSQPLNASDYELLVARVRELAKRVVPADATLAVVSRGDDALLSLDGRRAWHFPSAEDGSYLGYYPETGAEAVGRLKELAARGADYFVLPSMAFWWLEHYPELNRHLRESCHMVAGDEAGLVFALSEQAAAAVPPPASGPAAAVEAETSPLRDLTASLLPRDAITAVLAVEGGPVALEGARVWRLPRRLDDGSAGLLEALVASRIEFLVIPCDEVEWIERQSDLYGTLERNHRLVMRQQHVGTIYELVPPTTAAPAPVQRTEEPKPRRSLFGKSGR
jgi:hypothetical protein